MERPYIPPDLLEKYLNGTATPTENEVVERWYASLQGQPDYLSTLPESERQALQARTHQTIRDQLGLSRPARIVPLRPAWMRPIWVAAGGIAAAVALVVFIWFVRSPFTFSTPTTPVATAPALVRVVNQQPRLVAQRLPDGTVVWLHPRAELRYPAAFRGDRRDVTFVGEAFFDVAKDAKRPFLIQSGAMQVRVVGTRFNVRARPQQAVFAVAVVTGKVVVRSLKASPTAPVASVELLPNQQALYDVAANALTRRAVPTQARRELYEPVSIAFVDTPVREVLRRLESRFNIRLRVANPAVNACRLTADFADQPLPAILELLCTSLDATYTMSGDTIRIDSDGCQ